MLIRHRLSRIFFLRKFFNYPLSLDIDTIANLGLARILKILFSYIRIRLFPIREEGSLEDFFINRFGNELYLTFFKDYTEKVWGAPCGSIKPEWGAQRIKGLSVSRAIRHGLKRVLVRDSSIAQKETETSLIEQFMYPKLGPGQMWEEVARIVTDNGGDIYPYHKVVGVKYEDCSISEVTIRDERTGALTGHRGDYFLSTMPIKDLIFAMGSQAPKAVRNVAEGLIYRDFITVGLLLKKLKITNETRIKSVGNIVPDNWIYIQERDVKVGRIQIFNNWSPYMVKDDNTVWIGLEYFCTEGDDLWRQCDYQLAAFAIGELASIGFVDAEDVLESVVIRMAKAYPAYFGSFDRFNVIRDFTDRFENLFLIGRNGMHRYNNTDHSMLTAMAAVENIMSGVRNKDNVWAVNIDQEYQEENKSSVNKCAFHDKVEK
jgi:protoporphyrinogen oxidase